MWITYNSVDNMPLNFVDLSYEHFPTERRRIREVGSPQVKVKDVSHLSGKPRNLHPLLLLLDFYIYKRRILRPKKIQNEIQ